MFSSRLMHTGSNLAKVQKLKFHESEIVMFDLKSRTYRKYNLLILPQIVIIKV